MESTDRLAFHRRIIRRTLTGVLLAALVVRVGWLCMAWLEPTGLLPARPTPRRLTVQRALVISVDGLRPDVLLRARMPNVRALMARGAFTMWARTSDLPYTLPSHTSMLTGVRPMYHHVLWNNPVNGTYPDVPTLFEQAHKAIFPGEGIMTTGMVAGKSKFRTLARPGSIDFAEMFYDQQASDRELAEAASDMIRRHAPRVMFVHLPDVDVTGHYHGWGSPDQIEAAEHADDAVGIILQALVNHGFDQTTLIILTADHGGQGWSHGPGDPRSIHIPWIACGPGIKRNFDLSQVSRLVVHTEDTFATVCTMMDIPLPPYLDGRFVREMLVEQELIRPAPATTQSTTGPYDMGPPVYRWERTTMPTHHDE